MQDNWSTPQVTGTPFWSSPGWKNFFDDNPNTTGNPLTGGGATYGEIKKEKRNGKLGFYRTVKKSDGTEGIEEVTDQKLLKRTFPGYTPGSLEREQQELETKEADARRRKEAEALRNRGTSVEGRKLDTEARKVDNEGEGRITDRITGIGNVATGLMNADSTQLQAVTGLYSATETAAYNRAQLGHQMKMDKYKVFDDAFNRYVNLEKDRASVIGNGLGNAGATIANAFRPARGL